MTTLTTENQESTQATAPASAPKATTKANVAPRKPHVSPSKAKSGKKATPAKQGAKGVKRTAKKPAGAREGSRRTSPALHRSGRRGPPYVAVSWSSDSPGCSGRCRGSALLKPGDPSDDCFHYFCSTARGDQIWRKLRPERYFASALSQRPVLLQ
jgi:hypothetical protein